MSSFYIHYYYLNVRLQLEYSCVYLILIKDRCTYCTGELYPGTTRYYYGNYRSCIRYPWALKSLQESLVQMKRVEAEDRPSVRANLAKETGFTGLSILHRLYDLYGFDVHRDLVFDAMHNIPLNVASNHLHYYLNEGILSPAEIEERLKIVPWTPGEGW